MICIDSVQLCERAFLDDCDRLCMIGVMTRFPTPSLPIKMRQLMIVVRIADIESEKSFGIGVAMVTPRGVSLSPNYSDGFDVRVTTEYILITLHDIPFAEEGMHRFAVSVGQADPVSISVPVRLATKHAPASSEANQKASHAFGQSSWVAGREIN